jgi:hypothetical protein
MNAQEFAERYVGRKVITNDKHSRSGITGIVIGYMKCRNCVVIEALDYDRGFITTSKRCDFISQLYSFLLPYDCKALIMWTYGEPDNFDLLPKPSLPDDCLECGAKGNDPCKDNCPNKE